MVDLNSAMCRLRQPKVLRLKKLRFTSVGSDVAKCFLGSPHALQLDDACLESLK